jgi:U3 small nucleolar RNA-associated protein 15
MNRDEVTLQPVLRWIIKNIADYRITRLTTDVALVVLDLYADQLGRSEEVDQLVKALHDKVLSAVDASQGAWATQGMVDMLTASAGAGEMVEA